MMFLGVRGMSLVELMVAMVIGCLLVAAALTIYAQSSSTSRVNENAARLQEQGRYAMSVIQADAELAGFYGFTNLPETVRLVTGTTAAQMRQSLPPVAGLPPGAHTCGINFAVDVLMPVQGSNDRFDLGRARLAACSPYASGAARGTDTLTVRRVETKETAPEAGRLQMFAARLSSRTAHLLFWDGNAPGVIDADHRVLNLVVRSYYIARDSVARPGFPALRTKTLTRSGGNVVFDEDEVMTGIEDMQVQFGIDTGDHDNDGAIDPQADTDRDGIPEPTGRVTRYVTPDFPALDRYQVAAVRIWLRIRADEPEGGFVDDRTYRYAGVVFTPSGPERAFRRAVMSRTIAVRNARVY
jgi:type IV pilus assembly protein PilW